MTVIVLREFVPLMNVSRENMTSHVVAGVTCLMRRDASSSSTDLQSLRNMLPVITDTLILFICGDEIKLKDFEVA